ncbi:hypothetical protein [Bifidobacterium pseudolongum]|uniref:Uncharacterized protein n=1 Tax=Bifidobacterium pseudolongum subsp. globosum TaxID=1690 RepID=A0A2N3QN90_9BIFI|nr:hypothetical protein [Bifidobacterium pseudolongum]MCH4861043.1 hypothetical protein [Bifidobacterium pseudolongum]MCH4862764.1 hypothetical protein [Bifidobacterium pseudolongum]PKU93130.1 hypothetical protein CQR45_1800 [Bifidobacterium pseudolongum subsp. globosum]PKU98875.1 hypothetical protein CQR54_1767 [Bifidobacterium pseudolongum subsp. globosum]
MRQRTPRRLRAAKHRLQQLPELYEAYILMRFPFHQFKEDVAAYERAVTMYANHVDEIIDNLKHHADGREYLVIHAPSLQTLDDACDSFLRSIKIQTEVIVKPLHPNRYPRLVHRILSASKKRDEARERYTAAVGQEAEIIQLEYAANNPENDD